MIRNFTLKTYIKNYTQQDILNEVNECCLMICIMLNNFFKNEGVQKRFKKSDLPKIKIKYFTNKQRKNLEIDDYELALTEPTTEENTFTLYIDKNIVNYSSNTVHSILMHEAIHMIVDYSLQKLLNQHYNYPPELKGHIKQFKMICKMCQKYYGYKDLGCDGEINNSEYD